jgi:hypothetical protein
MSLSTVSRCPSSATMNSPPPLQEWKKLEEEDDDSYLASAWANPKQMKNQLNGTGNVSWRPGR